MTLPAEQYHWLFFTGVFTQISCWALHEFLEKKLGMEPKIMTSIALQKAAATKNNPEKAYEINKSLTKPLNAGGEYRIQTRGAIYFVKSLYTLILCISSITIFIRYPKWFSDHFIDLKADSDDFVPLHHVCATLIGYFSWEATAARYGRMQWTKNVQQWTVVGIALSILMGRYTAIAVWFGFTEVSMMFPVWFMLGFRAQYSFRYPYFTRKTFSVLFWWTLMTAFLDAAGGMFMITNSVLYHWNDSIPIPLICIMCIGILVWLYNDTNFLRELRTFSQQEYEEADILSTATDTRVVGDTFHTNATEGKLAECIASAKAENETTQNESVRKDSDVSCTPDGPKSGSLDQKESHSVLEHQAGHIITMNSSSLGVLTEEIHQLSNPDEKV